MPFSSACRLAGIGEATGNEWRARGEGTDPQRPCKPVYKAFARAVAHARAQDEASRVEHINKAAEGGNVVYRKTTIFQDGRTVTEERYAEGDWRADAWHLERSYADRWGQRLKVDVETSIRQAAEKVAGEMSAGGPPMTAEELIAEAEALLAEMDAEAEREPEPPQPEA